jgi:hypothetical protein
MSKKSTISFGDKFHLFEEDGEDSNIFLEIEDTRECSFELWQMSGDKHRSRAVVKIPIKYWKKMVEDWGKQPTGDKIDKKIATFD